MNKTQAPIVEVTVPETFQRRLPDIKTIVSHASCPDGTAAAIVLRSVYYPSNVRLIQYGPQRDLLDPEPGMLFVDMTPHEAKVQAFVDAGAYVIDHHRTQRGIVEAFGERGWYSETACGTEMAVAHMGSFRVHSETDRALIRRFALLAGVRDLWKVEHEHWELALIQGEALRFYPESWWFGDPSPDGGEGFFPHPPYLLEQEAQVGIVTRSKVRQEVKKLVDDRAFALHERCGVRVATLAAPSNSVSEAANAILEADLADVVVALFLVQEGAETRLVRSYRSKKGGVDVGEICKLAGGGGHRSAAGYSEELNVHVELNLYAGLRD